LESEHNIVLELFVVDSKKVVFPATYTEQTHEVYKKAMFGKQSPKGDQFLYVEPVGKGSSTYPTMVAKVAGLLEV
jgi:hypothetical protein